MPDNFLDVVVQMRTGDLNPGWHISNVAYFGFMETARIRFLESRGLPAGWPATVIHAECHYRQEVNAEVRELTVRVSTEKSGRTSATIVHEMYSGETHVATGRATLVVVDAEFRPRPLTDEEKTQLGAPA